ncbi:MAG: hypothetical protein SGJ19_17560 [Planctomycetia bacterium]|nr:hypothetical protein [Planctomycetia bacterium]
MNYRSEAMSLEGFVQQLASNILPHGYWFYVTGRVPLGKNPQAIDEKLTTKYGITISRQQRARRKLAGLANLHYLRIGSLWVLLATRGEHRFFAEEAEAIRDVRKVPLQVGGYSLTVRQGGFLKRLPGEPKQTPDSKRRVRVQIAREKYRDLKSYFLELSTRRAVEEMAREFFGVPFEPYAPIRRQLLNILRLVNAKRQEAGLAKVPPTVLRYRRRIVKPFEQQTDRQADAA